MGYSCSNCGAAFFSEPMTEIAVTHCGATLYHHNDWFWKPIEPYSEEMSHRFERIDSDG